MHQPGDSIFNILGIKGAYATPELSTTNGGHITCDYLVTCVSSGGAETRILDNGVEGQLKIIVAVATLTGTVTVTPTKFVSSTFALDAVTKTWIGIFTRGLWHTIGGTATVS